MMRFLYVNEQEISALMGLTHMQQVAYLLGIRPYMDRQTSIVGIKRRISYQSLAETLYVEPHQGIQSGSPSRQQLRRVIKSLERAGLIQVQSDEKHLILKCLLASGDMSVQNKADTNPTSETDTNETYQNLIKSSNCHHVSEKRDTCKTVKADIPQLSEDNNICFVVLREKFEKFWSIYPEPQNRSKAWATFQNLNPDDALFEILMTALRAQIAHHTTSQQNGHWVPHWKHPANWISQHSWNDELITYKNTEKTHGKSAQHPATKSSIDVLWESCKAGRDFEFSEKDPANIISFPRSKQR